MFFFCFLQHIRFKVQEDSTEEKKKIKRISIERYGDNKMWQTNLFGWICIDSKTFEDVAIEMCVRYRILDNNQILDNSKTVIKLTINSSKFFHFLSSNNNVYDFSQLNSLELMLQQIEYIIGNHVKHVKIINY